MVVRHGCTPIRSFYLQVYFSVGDDAWRDNSTIPVNLVNGVLRRRWCSLFTELYDSNPAAVVVAYVSSARRCFNPLATRGTNNVFWKATWAWLLWSSPFLVALAPILIQSYPIPKYRRARLMAGRLKCTSYNLITACKFLRLQCGLCVGWTASSVLAGSRS